MCNIVFWEPPLAITNTVTYLFTAAPAGAGIHQNAGLEAGTPAHNYTGAVGGNDTAANGVVQTSMLTIGSNWQQQKASSIMKFDAIHGWEFVFSSFMTAAILCVVGTHADGPLQRGGEGEDDARAASQHGDAA
eukprot:5051818-Amphidinium_carterae.1